MAQVEIDMGQELVLTAAQQVGKEMVVTVLLE